MNTIDVVEDILITAGFKKDPSRGTHPSAGAARLPRSYFRLVGPIDRLIVTVFTGEVFTIYNVGPQVYLRTHWLDVKEEIMYDLTDPKSLEELTARLT